MSSLMTVRDAIVATLAAQFASATPKVSVEGSGRVLDLSEIERVSMKTPLIRVVHLDEPGGRNIGGQTQMDITWGAFILTKDTPSGGGTLQRNDAAMQIAEAICGQLPLPAARWNTATPAADNAGPVLRLASKNLSEAEIDKKGLALWLVVWTQQFMLDLPQPANLGQFNFVTVDYGNLPAGSVPASDQLTLGSPT